MSSFSRTILRHIARTNMEKAGMTQIRKRKRDPVTDKKYSVFSESWRTYTTSDEEDEE